MDLIAKLEAASGPDRALDNEIANAIGLNSPADPAGWPPHFSASIDAALTLVPEGLYWHIAFGKMTDDEPLGAAGIIRPGSLETITEAEHASVIISICIAALKARAALTTTEGR